MELETEIRQFIRENFIVQGDVPLAADESLTQTGVIDSLGVLELVVFLEGRYGVAVSEAETLPENLDTVANITRFVAAKTGGAKTVGAEAGRTELPESAGHDQHAAA